MAEQKAPAKNGKGKMVVVIVVAIALVAAAAYVLTGDMRTYNQAVKLEEAASYDEAIAAYEAIPGYRDAATRINECKYQQALALEKTESYADAQAAFEALGDYADAAARVDEAKYQQALALEAAGSYAEAQAAFEAISEYADSAARVDEAKYQQALALEAAGAYADAQAAFEALGGYADAAAHANQSQYQQALALEEAGDYAGAQAAFEALGEHADAPARVLACKYQQALALEKAGAYADAQAAFEALGEHADAAARVKECQYQQALAAEATGSAAEALAAFAGLGDYQDSADRATGIQGALDQYDAEVARIAAQAGELDAAVSAAEALIAEGKTPLDPATAAGLQAAIDAAKGTRKELTAPPAALSDMVAETEALRGIDYAAATQSVLGARAALEDSVKRCEFVVAPQEAFVIDRLSRVPDIVYIAAVTEGNDPGGLLGKDGGYTAKVSFASTLVNPGYAKMPSVNVIQADANCGGSIEVYATVADAEKRITDLDSSKETVRDSHAVVGTVVVRISGALKEAEQKAFEAEIIEALTSLNPGPVIHRPQATEPAT